MGARRLVPELSKVQAQQLFDEGYELAFQTKNKIKPWGKIFDLWKLEATVGHVHAQFHLGIAMILEKALTKILKKRFIGIEKGITTIFVPLETFLLNQQN